MSGAAVRREQEPVHPSGVPSSWGRCSQRPPQVRSSALVQHVLFLQWVWRVLWSSACLQGRRETASTLPGVLFLCTGVQALGIYDWRTVPSPSAGGQDHLLEQEQVRIFGSAECFKTGECSFFDMDKFSKVL